MLGIGAAAMMMGAAAGKGGKTLPPWLAITIGAIALLLFIIYYIGHCIEMREYNK